MKKKKHRTNETKNNKNYMVYCELFDLQFYCN